MVGGARHDAAPRDPAATGRQRMTATIPRPALARIGLAHQGLLGRRRIGSGRAGALRVLERLGFVQIDTISVVARAHHHTFWSRAGSYREALPGQLVARGEAFEYWHHAAAYLPMRDYRFALPAMRAYARGERSDHGMVRCGDKKLLREVLARVRAEGPLMARNFSAPNRRGAGWWDWKPAKRALEQLFMQGDIMCVGREGFQKRYDLAERVLPPDVATTCPSLPEQAAHLIDTTLAAHGAATEPAYTYGRHHCARLRAAVKAVLAERVAAGTLETARGPDGALYHAAPGTLARRHPKPPPVARVLSPFDNSVIQRGRALALFNLDFKIECYVPEAKREWGYYCLPILYRDAFVGRMDCKARRATGVFEIKRLHLDAGLEAGFDPAFNAAVWEYARFLGCDDVQLRHVTPTAAEGRMRRCLA